MNWKLPAWLSIKPQLWCSVCHVVQFYLVFLLYCCYCLVALILCFSAGLRKQYPANVMSITAIKMPYSAPNSPRMAGHTGPSSLGTLVPPHKCFSYCPFVPLQNGVDACETERDTGGLRVHYSPLFSRGEWKITPLCRGRKSLPLTSWLRSVMSKGLEVCAV